MKYLQKNTPLLFIKYVFDFIIALAALIITTPLFIIISLCIKISSPGTIFFKQQRIGFLGKPFTIYKFRTMFADAEKEYTTLHALQYKTWGNELLHTVNDPRITPIGKILRKFALDELPQLFNILKGDMSLVGPRPLVKHEMQLAKKYDLKMLTMKPGLTGLWQVATRNKPQTIAEKAQYDLNYIDNWSLSLDVKIIFKTVLTIFKEIYSKRKT